MIPSIHPILGNFTHTIRSSNFPLRSIYTSLPSRISTLPFPISPSLIQGPTSQDLESLCVYNHVMQHHSLFPPSSFPSTPSPILIHHQPPPPRAKPSYNPPSSPSSPHHYIKRSESPYYSKSPHVSC